MNQEQNNLNINNFGILGNNEILNNQSFNNIFNQQTINAQSQQVSSFPQPIM